MIGLLVSHPSLTLGLLVPAVAGRSSLLVYLTVKYAPIIGQNFEEPPLFLPLRVAAVGAGRGGRVPHGGRARRWPGLPPRPDRGAGPA